MTGRGLRPRPELEEDFLIPFFRNGLLLKGIYLAIPCLEVSWAL